MDIVRDAVYKSLLTPPLREPEHFDTWITQIVINTALTHLQRPGSRSREQEEPSPDIPAEESDLTPEESMDLCAASDALPPDERTCVVLRLFEEHFFREIAEIMNVPSPH